MELNHIETEPRRAEAALEVIAGYTHKKRAYHAECVQYTTETRGKILRILGDMATPHGEEYIMVRHDNRIDTISHGWWVVRGENGAIKFYDEATHSIKYERI